MAIITHKEMPSLGSSNSPPGEGTGNNQLSSGNNRVASKDRIRASITWLRGLNTVRQEPKKGNLFILTNPYLGPSVMVHNTSKLLPYTIPFLHIILLSPLCYGSQYQ